MRATVGVRLPTWAAAPDETPADEAPPIVGTINLVVLVPTALTSAALVEPGHHGHQAKAQALLSAEVVGTGTASDVVLVACPAATADADARRSADRARRGRPRWRGPPMRRSPWASTTATRSCAEMGTDRG